MTLCMNPMCQTSAGCKCTPVAPFMVQSPRTMPVNMPIPTFGVTIAILDSDLNLTIKSGQPRPSE
jgi:hypothetical protein